MPSAEQTQPEAQRVFESLNSESMVSATRHHAKRPLLDHYDERPIILVKEKRGAIIVTFTFPGFCRFEEIKRRDGRELVFQQINITKTGYIAAPGKPLLPAFSSYVQIPQNREYRVSGHTLTQAKEFDMLVYPAQQGIQDFAFAGGPPPFLYNENFYNNENLLYPEKLVDDQGPFDIDEYRAVLLRVCPFQYRYDCNLKTRKLFGYEKIEVVIELLKASGKRRPTAMAINKEGFGNLFLNPGRSIEYRVKISPRRSMEVLTGQEFLIIYAAAFEEAAKKLAAWKNRRGIDTGTVSIEAIGKSPQEIKDYVRRSRRATGSRLGYVLLLGDVDAIESEIMGKGLFDKYVSDYYYSTREGPAAGGPKPLLPWLAIGRLPVASREDAVPVVDQIIAYEKDPSGDPSYYRRVVTAAFFEGDKDTNVDTRGYIKTMEQIGTYLAALGFDVHRVYTKNIKRVNIKKTLRYRNGAPLPDSVTNAFLQQEEATSRLIELVSRGDLIIAHRGHGRCDKWSSPRLTVEDLEEAKGNMPSVFFSINCLTGQFDLPHRDLCFAEKALQLRGSSPSLIAATDLTDTWLNNDLLYALFDALFGGLLATFPDSIASYPMRYGRLGDLLNYAKCYLPLVSSDTDEVQHHLEAYHLIGDPTLEIWKDVPRCLAMKAVIRASTLNVQLSECPAGSVITVWRGEKLLKKLEPSSTHFTISLQGLAELSRRSSQQQVAVCFWASGYRYLETVATRIE